jgi:hypothetical protein
MMPSASTASALSSPVLEDSICFESFEFTPTPSHRVRPSRVYAEGWT